MFTSSLDLEVCSSSTLDSNSLSLSSIRFWVWMDFASTSRHSSFVVNSATCEINHSFVCFTCFYWSLYFNFILIWLIMIQLINIRYYLFLEYRFFVFEVHQLGGLILQRYLIYRQLTYSSFVLSHHLVQLHVQIIHLIQKKTRFFRNPLSFLAGINDWYRLVRTCDWKLLRSLLVLRYLSSASPRRRMVSSSCCWVSSSSCSACCRPFTAAVLANSESSSLKTMKIDYSACGHLPLIALIM